MLPAWLYKSLVILGLMTLPVVANANPKCSKAELAAAKKKGVKCVPGKAAVKKKAGAPAPHKGKDHAKPHEDEGAAPAGDTTGPDGEPPLAPGTENY